MLKKILFILIFVLVASFYVYAQEDMRNISNSYFKNPQRSEALYNHDEHNTKANLEDCSFCHHSFDEQGNVSGSSEGTPCFDCHKEKQEGKSPRLMNAFHTRCIDCHKEKKQGPLSCGECHKK